MAQTADVTARGELDRVLDSIASKLGRIDAAMANAGSIDFKITDTDPEEFKQVIEEMPTTLDELGDVIRSAFHQFEQTDDVLQAAFASRVGRQSRWDGGRTDSKP